MVERIEMQVGCKVTTANAVVRLPVWLDSFIFDELHARYAPSCMNMTVIDWGREDILRYLGTYFPRSFAESYSIFSSYFAQSKYLSSKKSLSVFDFGCGTGGELIGLLMALQEQSDRAMPIKVHALDGNIHAVRILERIIEKFRKVSNVNVEMRLAPLTIDDFYDLDVIRNVLHEGCDVFLTFKAICEFVTKEQFERRNPYTHVLKTFRPWLNSGAITCLADITTYNDTVREWLPKMMDKGVVDACFQVLGRNGGFNEAFSVSHSRRICDQSKIAWRLLANKEATI